MTTTRPRLIGFPETVDEHAARLVATGVVIMCGAVLLGAHWVVVPLAYGFVARVLTGPRLSPLGLFVTRVVVKRLPLTPKIVPGPPKRFAQGIGATLSLGALVALGFGATNVTLGLVAAILVAASLEAALGFCLGCRIFALLMRIGVVPESTCEACNDISKRFSVPA